MLIQFHDYLKIENIYIWSNLGVLPFWVMLMLIPRSNYTQIFVNSIIIPLLLASAYVYVLYQSISNDEFIFEVFILYASIENLYTVFSNENILLTFWLHFLSLSLFLGSWISRDAIKFSIPTGLVFLPLLFTYFTGPLGLVFYWIIRIFYSRKLGLHD